ncbi:MAG: ABC-three component system protein [Clostridium sp.]
MYILEKNSYNDQDASSKWSGFNYQGKIAIYVALYLINNPQIAEKKEMEKWNVYSLEIEGLEDFAILKENEYISIHQVKAYTSSLTPSKLNNAFWGLIGKTIENKTIKKSCLHTLKEVVKLRNSTEENIKYIRNLKPDKEKEEKYKKSYGEKESLLKKVFDKLAFYDKHESYKLCVSLGEINELIKDEIKQYYKDNGYERYKCEEMYLKEVFNNILGRIDEHICKRHDGKLNQYNHINFEEVIGYITEVPDLASHEYFLYKLRMKIFDTTLEYCMECSELEERNNCENCNMKMYLEELNNLDNLQFISYIRHASINKELDKDSLNMDQVFDVIEQIKGYKDLLNRIEENENYQGIKDSKLVDEIDSKKYINSCITHLESNKRRKDVERMKISQSILNNLENDMELMLSVEATNGFISDDVDIESVKKIANKIGKSNDVLTDEKMEELAKQYDRKNTVNDITIISHERMEELKTDENKGYKYKDIDEKQGEIIAKDISINLKECEVWNQ